MPISIHFATLEANCAQLERKFIKDQLNIELHDIANFIPDPEFLAAYRFLVHAEIEDYLEKKARDQIISLRRMIAGPKYPSLNSMPWIYVLSSLCAVSLPSDHQYDEKNFFKKVNETLNKLEDKVNDNNGIKGETLKLVSLILGKGMDEIDQLLATNLTSFGEARGDIAHRSVSRVSTILAPSAEKQKVDTVIDMIRAYFNETP